MKTDFVQKPSTTPSLLTRLTLLLLLFATGFGYAATPVDLENHPGKAVYKKSCIECHGENGEGVEDKADDPLFGNRSLASLAGRIVRTMPEDDEDACVGDDADAVAAYIYDAFYSPEARARNAGSRRSLTHLTVEQYRNCVADLVGNFWNAYNFSPDEKRGLKGFYYGTRNFKGDEKLPEKGLFNRMDPVIRFDFAGKPPRGSEKYKYKSNEFSIRWSGSIIARETGVYEFTLRTRNGVTLYVNRNKSQKGALIDGRVAPNNEVRFEKGSIFLLGGRTYPVAIEYFKYKEDKGLLEFLWKPPHGVRETVPNRVLSPHGQRDTLVIETPFPADDRSYGYERGSSVSREWLEAVTAGASEAADYVVDHIDQLAGTKESDPKRLDKIGYFGVRFTEVAYRRPLSEKERIAIVDRRFKGAKKIENAVRNLVLYVLTSPQFLYPETSFEKADSPWAKISAMTMTLWDSLPSRHLNDQLRKGHFNKPENFKQAAWDMLGDPRGRHKVHGFFDHWLELERAHDISKDRETFPDFSPAVMADLRTSLDLFIDDAVWKNNSDFRNMLLADSVFLNPRLAKIYGGAGEVKSGFQKVSLAKQHRAGIITHPYLLTAFAYHNSTSPIHRGVFLTRNIVGMSLKPPPKASKFEPNKFNPSLTMREKVTDMTRSKACMACHTMINPLGFSLEHFDGIGRFRVKEENNKPIDVKGQLPIDGGKTIPIKGPRDVAKFAANDPGAHKAFIRQLFQHFVKQSPDAYGSDTMKTLQKSFTDSGFRMQNIFVEIALVAAQSPPEKEKKIAISKPAK